MVKSFRMIPTDDELAGLERDLKFYPSTTVDPKCLTSEQIESFNRNGFLSPLPAFSQAEIDSIREYFDQLLRRVTEAGGDSYSISSAHLSYGPVYDLLTSEIIVGYVRDLLGPDVVAWGSHFFCKLPGDGKSVAWHQDASYWPLTPSKAVTVWLAIDDADPENACVRFVAGSQRAGHLTFRQSSPEEHNVLNQSIDDPEAYGTIVDNILQAGQISIHSDLLLHGSESNDSSRRRCGLTLRYCAADVRAGLDWNQKGVIVSGSDVSGHWSHLGRPE